MSSRALRPVSAEFLGLRNTPHRAFYSLLTADRNKNPLSKGIACMVLDDFISFAQKASKPERADRNSKDIQNGFSRIAIFCERTPGAQEYVRRGFTESDKPTDRIPQLAIPVAGADVLFDRLFNGELGSIRLQRTNKLAIRGLGEKSLHLACAAMQAVHAGHPDLRIPDTTAVSPAIGPPLLQVGQPAFIDRISRTLDLPVNKRSD